MVLGDGAAMAAGSQGWKAASRVGSDGHRAGSGHLGATGMAECGDGNHGREGVCERKLFHQPLRPILREGTPHLSLSLPLFPTGVTCLSGWSPSASTGCFT